MPVLHSLASEEVWCLATPLGPIVNRSLLFGPDCLSVCCHSFCRTDASSEGKEEPAEKLSSQDMWAELERLELDEREGVEMSEDEEEEEVCVAHSVCAPVPSLLSSVLAYSCLWSVSSCLRAPFRSRMWCPTSSKRVMYQRRFVASCHTFTSPAHVHFFALPAHYPLANICIEKIAR